MPFFCISFRSWNAINLKRLRKETWKTHRTRGRCWKHSRAVWELQAGDWQLPLPTWEELFQCHWSCRAWGTELCPVLPHCCICACLNTATSLAQGVPGTTAQVPCSRAGSTGTGLAGMGQAVPGFWSMRWSQSFCMAALRPRVKCFRRIFIHIPEYFLIQLIM